MLVQSLRQVSQCGCAALAERVLHLIPRATGDPAETFAKLREACNFVISRTAGNPVLSANS